MSVRPVDAVLLNKNLNTHGTWIHSVEFDGFATLYVTSTLNDNVENANDKVVLHVGHRDIPIEASVSGCVLVNFPVHRGEELWANVSTIDRYIMDLWPHVKASLRYLPISRIQ